MSYANPTSASNYIDALNFGTSAETVSTLGDDRTDTRIPPDAYHSSGLQITRIKALVLGMSQYLAGGNRLRVLPNAANQFGAGEYGYALTTTLGKITFNGGTAQTIAAGVMAAKGDGLFWTGSAWSVVTVGANGTQLTADSTASAGVAWAGAASSGGVGGFASVTIASAAQNYLLAASTAQLVVITNAAAVIKLPASPTVGNVVECWIVNGLNANFDEQTGAHVFTDINTDLVLALPRIINATSILRFCYVAANDWRVLGATNTAA